MTSLIKKIWRILYSPDRDIRENLINLTLVTVFFGSFIVGIISLFVNGSVLTTITIFSATILIAFCIYLSCWRGKSKIAALLIVLITNELLLPGMYLTSGGVESGMPIWFVVGLTYSFLVLQGKTSIIMFVVNAITMSAVMVLEYFFPQIITYHLPDMPSVIGDSIQSMLIVGLIFGVVFKFQTFAYEKQKIEILKRDKELTDANKRLQDTLEELEAASNAKTIFLANMSHEIRTPINAILGMDEILLRENKDETIEEYAVNIRSASNNLLSIVNDILDFSKIESGKMEIVPVEYKFADLIMDCYNLVSQRASSKNLLLVFVNDPTIPSIMLGDEIRVRQIITNLLTNAVKYTEEGSVTLSIDYVEVSKDCIDLVIKIKDTGIGISIENQKKLFESFQRLDVKRNRTIEGTGLGLAISQRLTYNMGGNLMVESDPGQGSLFTAIIPQCVIDRTPAGTFESISGKVRRDEQKYKEQFRAPDARILAVDDVKMNLDVIKGLLRKTQIQVDCALSGKEALKMMSEHCYDLVLLDHMMPEMDGIETMKAIKNLAPPHNKVPLVVLTANAIYGVEQEYLSIGFDAYLSKPVKSVDLERTLMEFLPSEKIQKAD